MAKHSSILKILTKWAKKLEYPLKNPESYIKRKKDIFRTLKGDDITLWN